MNIKPLGNRVLIRPEMNEKKLSSGLIIPDTADTVMYRAEVLEVGEGEYNQKGVFVPTRVKPGDKIIFVQGSGQEIELNRERLRVIREIDVIGIITE
jgi:chaperonin GroES